MKFQLKSLYPHLFAIFVFLVISYAYFYPVLEGKRLLQTDVSQFRGMSKEIMDHREQTGEDPLWTNSMFGGMPAYLISVRHKTNLFRPIDNLLKVGTRPASYLFLFLIGFYIALLLFGVGPWLAIPGAIAFSFSSFWFALIGAGHNTQVVTLAYMPPVIAGIYHAYRKNMLTGSAVAGFFLALQISAGHYQMIYYAMILVLILAVVFFIHFLKVKRLRHFFLTSSLLILAAIPAVGVNASKLWLTLEYSKYSTRGESELTHDEETKTSGLDKDYATSWSYGVTETFTLLIPNFKGGKAYGALDTDSETYKVLKQNNVENPRRIIRQLPLYHGPQPWTDAPVYIGAVVLFLFFMAVFLLRGPVKWWLLTATILCIPLAWGRHFPPLTEFMLDHFPLYNKFRNVSWILVIAEFTIPVTAFLGLRKLFTGQTGREEFMKAFQYALFITGGIALLFTLMPGLFNDFTAPADSRLNWPDFLMSALREDRKSLVRSDAFRSLLFVGFTATLIYFHYQKKIREPLAIALLAGLILLDMWVVDKRYLDNSGFIPKRKAEVPFTPGKADKVILQDPDPSFRVLNLSVSTFNDASTSYFHKSVGGYHGAKMKRYQELIEFHISREMNSIVQELRNQPSQGSMEQVLAKQHVLNMLNTRYIIYNQGSAPLYNNHANGNAWFVHDVIMVDNADQEIAALDRFDPAHAATVDQRFEKYLEDISLDYDSAASIVLTHYEPNQLIYESEADSPRLAVFSEIYYPEGWKAYINGQPQPHFRADYVLRAMVVPAGNNTIGFRFEPSSYKAGMKISLVSSVLLLLFTAFSVFMGNRKKLSEQQKDEYGP